MNVRPLPPQGSALPTATHPDASGYPRQLDYYTTQGRTCQDILEWQNTQTREDKRRDNQQNCHIVCVMDQAVHRHRENRTHSAPQFMEMRSIQAVVEMIRQPVCFCMLAAMQFLAVIWHHLAEETSIIMPPPGAESRSANHWDPPGSRSRQCSTPGETH